MVFCLTGGMGPQASVMTKRLAQKLSEKRNVQYSQTVGWLNTRISFALPRSVLVCLRGSRSLRPKKIADVSIELAVVEAKIAC